MMKKEQEFKFRCERLAREITRKTDIIFVNIRYKEFLHNVYYEKGVCYCDNPSEVRMNCSEFEIARYKNRIQVTLVGIGVGAQSFTPTRRNSINRILKTNAKFTKDSETQTHQIVITFNVNPHKM